MEEAIPWLVSTCTTDYQYSKLDSGLIARLKTGMLGEVEAETN